MEPADLEEFRALRREIELRIVLQNLFLVLTAIAFSAAALIQLASPEMRFQISTIYAVFTGMLSLFWVHSGARTVQIKAYLTEELEPRMRASGGWERWHVRRRVAGVLGARWFISTKGVLVGAQAALLGFSLLLAPLSRGDALWCALAILAIPTSALLLTKPRLAETMDIHRL